MNNDTCQCRPTYDQAIFDSKDELAVSVKKNAFALQGAHAHVHSSDISSYISLRLSSSSGKVIEITTPGQTRLEDLLERIRYNVARYQEVPVHSTESKCITKVCQHVQKDDIESAMRLLASNKLIVELSCKSALYRTCTYYMLHN